MKKIIALLILFFAFTFNVSAQDASKANELAKKDVALLSTIVKVSPQAQAKLSEAFLRKHEAYTQGNLSEERKKIVAKSIDAKLRATLSADEMTKLQANAEVYKQLTQN